MKDRKIGNGMNRMAQDRAQKKNTMAEKITAAVLCAALTLGGAGASMALTAEAGTVQNTVENKNPATPEQKPAKEETVYVWAGADGNVQKIIVSDWLKNTTGAHRLEDVSELLDIENINGNETFTENENHAKVWNANGKDIYYQGNIQKDLPVEIKITYLLDGKEISPEALAGKSGKVTIRFSYVNKQYEYLQVKDVKTKVYVPFVVVTGMILNNETFTNVEVENGRLINDGTRTMVMGYAMPGLQDNLAIGANKLELPDSFAIRADVKNFEMGMTVSIVTNELFQGADMDSEKLAGDLNKALEELTDAMGQLTDGSSQLYEGLCTLLDKSGELVEGVNRLSQGASQLRDGVGSLGEGAAKLQDGSTKLQSGLNTLAAKNGELNGGARQVFDTLLSAARTQLVAAGLEVPALTVENYGDVLNGVIASLDKDAVYQKAQEQVTAAVEARRGEIETAVNTAVQEQVVAQVTAAVRADVEEQVVAGARENVVVAVLQSQGMTKEEYEAGVAAGAISQEQQVQIADAIDSQMASEAVQAQIASTVETQMGSADVQALIETNVTGQMSSDSIRETIAANIEQQVQKAISENMAGETVQGQLAAASEGAKAVIALKQSLDSYNVFYLGVQAYTAGVAEAANGAGQLRSGVDELQKGTGKLYAGASELCDGITTMKNNTPALVDGITELRDGAGKLSDGLQEFDEEGIQKLVDAVDDDMDGLAERLRATMDASKHYKTFSGLSKEMEGGVKFIYRTDSIEIEK